MRAFDAYKILDEQEAGSLIDLIAPCMDDYLYIIDLKNDTLRISQSAVERFMLPDKFMNDATKHLRTLVYEKDRKLLENHKRKIYDGKEKRYNVLCRLMNSKNLPVWIKCRGEVINDEAGKPRYIIGCMNETGTRQRADNISGLLGEKEMASYLYSQPSPIFLSAFTARTHPTPAAEPGWGWRICQAHHAAIRAESGQDGTTFRVEIRKEQGEHHGN